MEKLAKIKPIQNGQAQREKERVTRDNLKWTAWGGWLLFAAMLIQKIISAINITP